MKRIIWIIFLALVCLDHGFAQKSNIQVCSEQDIASSIRPKYRNQVELFLENYYAGLLFNVGDDVIKETFIEKNLIADTQRYKPEFLLKPRSHDQFLTPAQYLQELDKEFRYPWNRDNLSFEVSDIRIHKDFYKKGMASCYLMADYNLTLKDGERILFKRKCRAYCLFPSAMAYIHVNLMQVEPVKDIIPYKPIDSNANDFNNDTMELAKGKPYPPGWAERIIPVLKNYQQTGTFLNGRCKVKSNGKWGMIDENGTVVIPFEYDSISHDRSLVTGSKGGWIEIIYPEKVQTAFDYIGEMTDDGLALFHKDGKSGFMNMKGEMVVQPVYDKARAFKNGRAAVSKSGLWGYLDTQGNEIIPLKYDEVGDFNEGMANVLQGKKWGYIDMKGQTIIPFQYNEADGFVGQQAIVFIKNKHCLIDPKGNVTVKADKYNFSSRIKDGLVMVTEKDKKFMATDLLPVAGNIARAFVSLTKKRGYMNRNQELVIDIQFSDARDFSKGMAAVRDKDKRWGYINTKGELVIPYQYDKALDYSDGLAPVLMEGKWKYIDKNAETAIPYEFIEAESFHDGKALVNYNGLKCYINTQGDFIR